MAHWLSAPDYSPKVPGSNPASLQPMADCHLQVGCHQRWDYLAIGCPLGGGRGTENPTRTEGPPTKKKNNNNYLYRNTAHIRVTLQGHTKMRFNCIANTF
jgi:hypothetical protein